MGYQALLFCPDEKTARTVTQVLSELDFSVIPCTEPFAAVKKLMGERFDAVVVDCDNEQNATLLFKSARNAANNQSSLAVAVVEGQAGVAKAFRIGANLVLTKPINVEQAKGTLRVARGLLRKNEGAKPASAAATPAAKPMASVAAPLKPVSEAAIPNSFSSRPTAPIMPVSPAPSILTQKPPQPPSVMASAPIEIDEETLDSIEKACDPVISKSVASQPVVSLPAAPSAQSSEPKIVSATSSPVFSEHKTSGSFAASAPAPARESQVGAPVSAKPPAVISPAIEPTKTEANEKNPSNDAAPTLTFGGTAADDSKPESGGSKKALWAVAVAVAVAVGGYAAWTQRGSFTSNPSTTNSSIANPSTANPSTTNPGVGNPSSSVNVASQPTTTAVPAPVAQTTNAPHAASTSVSASSAPETRTSVPQTSKTTSSPATRLSKVVVADSSAFSPSANKTVAANETPAPIVIKSQHSQSVEKVTATVDAPALSVTEIAQDKAGTLPNLMGSDAPTPVLQRVMVSQGVSRGLLVKQVQPVYPRSALQMHIEGAVQLMATVTKNGDISEVKTLSGDTQLAHAATDAVKRWKYKPYLLNGEPVDIQTQITVNFKLPR
jgi:TonB family protein